MTEAPLYAASVPVLLHYLGRMRGMVRLVEARPELLGEKLTPDMFSFGQQIATAVSFSLRATYPLVGGTAPALPEGRPDAAGLEARIAAAEAALRALDPAGFVGAEAREVRHRAGFAELAQDGAAYLHGFALPNFFFHLSMAFAILRANGVEIGKADFDGQHDYPQGFRF